MAQNLKRYDINCPACDGVNFVRGVHLSYGPNGMQERTGEFVCLECREKLPLEKAVRLVEMERKRDELRLMQEEMESLSA